MKNEGCRYGYEVDLNGNGKTVSIYVQNVSSKLLTEQLKIVPLFLEALEKNERFVKFKPKRDAGDGTNEH